MLQILDRWSDGKPRKRKDGTSSHFGSRSRRSPLLFLCCPRTSVFASLTTSNPESFRDMADFDAPPSHTEILLPLGGKHPLSPEPPSAAFWEFHESSKSGRSKKKGQPGEALPRISNDKIQNSKGKPGLLLKTAAPCVGWPEGFRLQGVDDRERPESRVSHCEWKRSIYALIPHILRSTII